MPDLSLLAVIDLAAVARFVDPLGLLIVVGGSMAAALFASGWAETRSSIAALRWLRRRAFDPERARSEVARLDRVARRHGILAIEAEPVSDPTIGRAARALVDGAGAGELQALFDRERAGRIRTAAAAPRFWAAVADVAPGAGMIGTIAGLVGMFADMDDLARIGPAMALALLTTLYGAVLANLIAGPIAQRLARLAEAEEEARRLVEPQVLALARVVPVRRRAASGAAAA